MKKIFILDDNAMILESTFSVLEKDFEVMCCRDIVSASRRMKLFKFDLIVIDLMLPTRGLDIKDEFNAGFNFYIQYVEPKQRGVPVLFWSNLTDASYKKFVGAHPEFSNIHFLQKNDDINSLSMKIKEIIG